MYSLKTPLQAVKGIGPKLALELEKHDLRTVKDLLLQLPLRYEDRSHFCKISEMQLDELVTFQAKISSISQNYKNKRSIQSAKATDETGSIKLMWFNNKFILSRLSEGNTYLISGKKNKFNTVTQPVIEDLKADTIHTNRLVPIYSSTIALKQGSLRRVLKNIIDNLDEIKDELLPHISKLLPSALPLKKVLQELHFPDEDLSIEASRERLVLEEFLSLMKQSKILKEKWHQQENALSLEVGIENIDQVEKIVPGTLPFKLTQAQKRVTYEIIKDMNSKVAMNRLLIGDVGSGKTIVAGLAAQEIIKSGGSVALVAPTKILAEQHFKSLSKIFNQIEINLVTSATKTLGKSSDPILYVGTHAIINRLEKLEPALIIYDEQHRFGVRHRSESQQLKLNPHILTMTATPIPRSMMLTLFSHLKLSVIDELPPGRKPPTTWLVPEKKRSNSYEWIKDELKKEDQQVIVVCPFIDPSESEALENVSSATETYNEIKSVFNDHEVGLLHGRQKKKEQEQIIKNLFDKKIQILVTTPIVEVGVDLPQASIIVIEASERFGLASLHQLRGRVGRAGQESYCLLFTTTHSQQSKERLKIFTKENDGLKLAELDLQNRGAGDIFGTVQSGFTGLKYGSWSNTKMIEVAQKVFPLLDEHWQPQLIELPEMEESIPLAN